MTQNNNNMPDLQQPWPLIVYFAPIVNSLSPCMWIYIYFFNPSHRQRVLDYQRALVYRFLNRLGIEHSPEFADQTWHEQHSSALGIGASIAVTVGNSMSYLIEGLGVMTRLVPVFIIPFIPFYYLYVRENSQLVQLGKVHLSMMMLLLSVTLSGVFLNSWVMEYGIIIGPEVIKRNLFNATLVSLFMFESLEDAFVLLLGSAGYSVVTSIMYGHNTMRFVNQFFSMMGLVILITMTSMRGRMYAIVHKLLLRSPQFQDSSIKFYTSTIATCFLFATMYATTIPSMHLTTMLKDIAISIHVPVMFIVWRGAPMVDVPITITHRGLQRQQMKMFFADAIMSMFQIVCALAFPIVDRYDFDRWIATTESPSMAALSMVSWFIVVSLGAYGALLCSSSISSAVPLMTSSLRYSEIIIRLLNLVTAFAQLTVLFTCNNTETAIIGLGVMRIIMLGIGRAVPFFDLCVTAITLSLASVVVAESTFTVFNALGLASVYLLMAVEISLVHKSLIVTMQSNVKAQGFVEHALKQKFVGCLDAVEEVLKQPSSTLLSDEQRTLLKNVARTCMFGLDQTYYYTLQRRFGRLTDDNVGQQPQQVATLNEVVQEWKSSWADEVEWIKSPKDESSNYTITKRWDLMRLVLHKVLGQNLTNVVVTYGLRLLLVPNIVANDPNVTVARIDFIITRKGKRPGSQLRMMRDPLGNDEARHAVSGLDPLVVQEMHASCTLREDGTEICLSFNLTANVLKLVTTSASSSSSIGVESDHLPDGLVFAILDDIKLVRLNALRFFVNKFNASSDSFCMGGTKQEALVDFVGKCLNTHVDVALVDIHLEYDDDFVLGTTVASDLRARGFKGTIMLHSANEQSIALRGTKVGTEDIDGFLEKKAFQKEYTEQCVLAAMKSRERIVGGR